MFWIWIQNWLGLRALNALGSAIVIAAAYCMLATLWILFSDRIVADVVADTTQGQWLQTAKGLVFVAVTTGLLFILIYRKLRSLERALGDLRESRRKHITLLSNLPGMAYRCRYDECWTMLFVSKGCEALTGYRSEQLLHNRQTSYEQLIHPDDRDQVRDVVDEAVRRGVHFRVEYRIRDANGVERWVWEQGVPVTNDDGETIALEGFIIDITERRKTQFVEKELANLRESSRTAEQVLGVIGHELRTPLAALRLLAESLLTDAIDREQQAEFIRNIHEQTIRITEMANNMLEAARLDSDLAAGQWNEFSLRQVCRECVNVIQPLADKQNVKLTAEVAPRDLRMRGDAEAIRRLFVNLLSNACRYTSDGEVTIRAHDAAGAGHEKWIELQVADNGSGMPPEIVDKLGQAFALKRSQLEPDASAGAGLGLAICRRIVAVHGGHITVHSQPGEGSLFIIHLRADLEQPSTADDPDQVFNFAA